LAEPAIEFRNLKKSYPVGNDSTIEVVKDISLKVRAKELVSLLGPSGSGKSTILAMVAGLTSPTGGEVRVNGDRVEGPRPKEITIVFQEPNLLPWRRADQNVRYGLELRGGDLKVMDGLVEKYLNLVGLQGFEKYYPSQLSGGMAQRVALARALALETGIMLLDEPFGALDENTRSMLGDELLRIKSITEKTMLFVTHSIEEAVHLSDRVLILSARPARVKDDIRINLETPRTVELRCSPEFQEYKIRIWQSLKDELNENITEPVANR